MRTIFITIIVLLTLCNLNAQNLKPEQMTDRHTLGLKGNVKSVIYSNGQQYTFNEAGNFLSVPIHNSDQVLLKHYVSEKRYKSGDEFYNILYTTNTRKDIWDNPEGLYTLYTFNKQGRIIERDEFGYSAESEKYIYTDNEDLIYQRVKYSGWEDGSSESTETFTYTSKDDNGNWTARNVKVINKESEYDWDTEKSIETQLPTTQHVETAQIVYFSQSEATNTPSYFSEADIMNMPSTAKAMQPSIPLKDKIPTWAWIVLAIMGVALVFLLTKGYPLTYDFLSSKTDVDFMPKSAVIHYITIGIGILLFASFLLFDKVMNPYFNLTIGILAGLILIGSIIIFIKNKTDKKLAAYKIGYFVLTSILGLLASFTVIVVVVWAIFIFVVYVIIFKILLKSMFSSSGNLSKSDIEKCPHLDNKDVMLNFYTCSLDGVTNHKCTALKTGKCPHGVI